MQLRHVPPDGMPAVDHAGAPRLGPREFTAEHMGGAPNALRYWYRARRADGVVLSTLRILRNYAVMQLLRHWPSLSMKNVILRALGVKIGRNVFLAPGVALDFFFPELIEFGDDVIVGLGAHIITHEFLHDRLRIGRVRVGNGALVGAQSFVLAGVSIGDRATISAGSFVNRSVPARALVRGNPCSIVRLQPAEKDGDSDPAA